MGDTAANVRAGMAALERLGTVTARSHLYSSRPWSEAQPDAGEHEPSQPDYANAAVLLETALSPWDLLARLKALETELGRSPSYRYGPRSIDLDILAYDDVRICEPELRVPHARLYERAFALAPLAEIDSSFRSAYEALPSPERAAVVAFGSNEAPLDPSRNKTSATFRPR